MIYREKYFGGTRLGPGTHPPSPSSALHCHTLLQTPQPLRRDKQFPFHFWEDAVPQGPTNYVAGKTDIQKSHMAAFYKLLKSIQNSTPIHLADVQKPSCYNGTYNGT